MNQRKVWLVLLIILGFSLPIGVEAMPGGESPEDTHHGSRMRSREQLVARALAWPAIPVIRVASVQLPRRALLERSIRPMTAQGARKIPPPAASSPAGTADH